MANWTLDWRLYPDGSGGNHRHLCYVSDDATPQIVFASTLVAPNFADPDQFLPIHTLVGPMGNGLAQVGIGQQMVVGADAAGNPITRNAVLVGGEALASVAAPTPWNDAAQARIGLTRDQRTITSPFGAPADFVASLVMDVETTSEFDLIPAPTTGVRIVPLSISVSNESAVNLAVTLKNGAGGAAIARVGAYANGGPPTPYPGGLWSMTKAVKLVGQLSASPAGGHVWVHVTAMHSKLP